LFTTRCRAANEGIDLRKFTVKKKMMKTQILFCAEEGERTGGLTSMVAILSCARRLRGQKAGPEVRVRAR
jgi:hypothetical protein